MCSLFNDKKKTRIMSEREIIEIGKWLNTKGYDIEFDKDGFWWEEWRWGEHTTKDVIELIYDYNKSKLNKLHITDVSKRETFSERELLIACSIKAQGDMFKSDRPRTVEESVDEFLSNL